MLRVLCACRYYSLFTLFMLVMFECTVVGQRLRNLHDVRALQQPKQVRGWLLLPLSDGPLPCHLKLSMGALSSAWQRLEQPQRAQHAPCMACGGACLRALHCSTLPA